MPSRRASDGPSGDDGEGRGDGQSNAPGCVPARRGREGREGRLLDCPARSRRCDRGAAGGSDGRTPLPGTAVPAVGCVVRHPVRGGGRDPDRHGDRVRPDDARGAGLLERPAPEDAPRHRERGVRAPRPGPGRVHRVRHRRPARPRAGIRRRGDRGPGGRGVPRRDRRGAPRGFRRPRGEAAEGAGVPETRDADPRHPGRRVGRRRVPDVPRRRRADPAAHGVAHGVAPGDEHRLERRPRPRPRGDDRLRHGRPGEQGRVLLRRGDDQGRQLLP